MDHTRSSPSAGSLRRSSRNHYSLRGAAGAYHGDDVEDENPQQGNLQQQQHLLPPSPNLSLRRILEQRNLLPMRRAPSTTPAVFASPDEDALSATHSPLPSLRFARSPRDRAADIAEFPPQQDWGRTTAGSVGGYEYSSYNTLRRLRSMTAQQQHRAQPLPGRSSPLATVPPAPPATVSSSQIISTQLGRTGLGHSRRRAMTTEERRKARTCVIDGCNNYIVDSHRCFRHGVSVLHAALFDCYFAK